MATLREVRQFGKGSVVSGIPGTSLTMGAYSDAEIAAKYAKALTVDLLLRLDKEEGTRKLVKRGSTVKYGGMYIDTEFTAVFEGIEQWKVDIESTTKKMKALNTIIESVALPLIKAATKELVWSVIYAKPAKSNITSVKLKSAQMRLRAKKYEDEVSSLESMLKGAKRGKGYKTTIKKPLAASTIMRKLGTARHNAKLYSEAYGTYSKQYNILRKETGKSVRLRYTKEGVSLTNLGTAYNRYLLYIPTYNLMRAQVEGIYADKGGITVGIVTELAPYAMWVHEGHDVNYYGLGITSHVDGRPWLPRLRNIVRKIMRDALRNTLEVIVSELHDFGEEVIIGPRTKITSRGFFDD